MNKRPRLLSASCLSLWHFLFKKWIPQIKKQWPWFILIMVLSLSEYRLEFWCYLCICFGGNALLSSMWQRKWFKNGTRRLKRRIPVVTLNPLIVARVSGVFWYLIESRSNNTDHTKTVTIVVTGASELWSCSLKYWVLLQGKNQRGWLTIAATKLMCCVTWEGLMHILELYSQLCELTFGRMKIWESALPSGGGGEAAASVTDTNLSTAQRDTGSPVWVVPQLSAGGLHVPAELPLVYLHWAGPWNFLKQCLSVLCFSLSMVVGDTPCLLSFKACNCFQLLALEDSDLFLDVNLLGSHIGSSIRNIFYLFWIIGYSCDSC